MNGWVFVLGTAAIVLLWLLVRWLYFAPVERKYKRWVRACLDKQAQKRNGTVMVTNGRPTLTVPYKTVNIDLSLIKNNQDLYKEYSYARFRTDLFTDKEITILLNSKDFFLKPAVLGPRVEFLDEEFNQKYLVTSNDASFVNGLLNQEVRDKLSKESLQAKFGRRTRFFHPKRGAGMAFSLHSGYAGWR